jgi:hypothetical protein
MHLGVDLRPRAMHQHQADAHAVEQRDVMDQRLRRARLQHFAAEGDDEGAAAKGVDVGRRLAHPGDQAGIGVGLAAAGLQGHGAGLPFFGLAARDAGVLARAACAAGRVGLAGGATGLGGLAGVVTATGLAGAADFIFFVPLSSLPGFSGFARGTGLPSSSASSRSQIVRRILTRA